MEILRNGSRPSQQVSPEYFTGRVRLDPLFATHDPARAAGALVTFEPGARTAWHTHPLGQTLTMITIAAKLLREAQGGTKPTVLMLVDRNELEAQLFKNITGYGIGTFRLAESKR